MRIVQVFDRKGLDRLLHVFAPEAEPQRGVQTINDVQVVSPALGPIFPRMDRGVRTDVTVGPILRRPLVVVPLECRAVIFSFVSGSYPSGALHPRHKLL